jgi:hypothetical protein
MEPKKVADTLFSPSPVTRESAKTSLLHWGPIGTKQLSYQIGHLHYFSLTHKGVIFHIIIIYN